MFKFCFSYPEPLYHEFRISSSRLVITGNQSSVSISISRFLFAFFSMRFSRYVFALYCFAIQCSGRLILRNARPPGRFRSPSTLFGNAVRECSSEPSKRYMRESFTRPRVVQSGIAQAALRSFRCATLCCAVFFFQLIPAFAFLRRST